MTGFEGRPDVDIQALDSIIKRDSDEELTLVNNALLGANPEEAEPLRLVDPVFAHSSFCPSRQQIRKRPGV